MRPSRRTRLGIATVGLGLAAGAVLLRGELAERKVVVVEPGRVVRGAWQRPIPLRRLIAREGIRTVVTLTAINRDDPKYLAQEPALREAGVQWVIVPMRGSTATLDQMAEAADLLADPSRQPVFFHCVGGHHRSNLVQAAYRIRHRGWTAEAAWAEVADLPWTRPHDDEADRRLIADFAARFGARPRKDSPGDSTTHAVGPEGRPRPDPGPGGLRRDPVGRG